MRLRRHTRWPGKSLILIIDMRITASVLFFACFLSIYSQPGSAFDRFGPYGSPAFTSMKEALNAQEKVYRLDISYHKPEAKENEKLPSLTDLQAMQLRSINFTVYP